MPNIKSVFKPLYTTKKRYILLTGGRGSAKTYTVQDYSTRLTFQKDNKQLYTRYTLTSAKKSIIPEYRATLERLNVIDNFLATDQRVVNQLTGNYVLFSGIKASSNQQRANLKSLPEIATWIQEEGEDFHDEEMFDKIDDSIRTKNCQNRIIWIQNSSTINHFIYERFFRDYLDYIEIDGYQVQISKHPDVEHIHTTYLDNVENLSESFLDKAYGVREKAKAGDLKAQHFYINNYLGAWVKHIEGALWKFETIENTRVSKHPQLTRIGIAIDPASTAKKYSDETGLVIAGLGVDGDAYVLEDLSGVLTPDSWGRRVVSKWQTMKLDIVVYETNQGGDMVKAIIQNIDNSIVPKGIHASRGKYSRAEPVAQLYEDGRVHHVGNFGTLEMQMTTWTNKDEKSPDRMDALVYIITELMMSTGYGTHAG